MCFGAFCLQNYKKLRNPAKLSPQFVCFSFFIATFAAEQADLAPISPVGVVGSVARFVRHVHFV